MQEAGCGLLQLTLPPSHVLSFLPPSTVLHKIGIISKRILSPHQLKENKTRSKQNKRGWMQMGADGCQRFLLHHTADVTDGDYLSVKTGL